jgi:hypothetical protein
MWHKVTTTHTVNSPSWFSTTTGNFHCKNILLLQTIIIIIFISQAEKKQTTHLKIKLKIFCSLVSKLYPYLADILGCIYRLFIFLWLNFMKSLERLIWGRKYEQTVLPVITLVESWHFATFQKWSNSQNYWVFGLCPSSSILKAREHNISETGSVSVLRWGGRHLLSWVP